MLVSAVIKEAKANLMILFQLCMIVMHSSFIQQFSEIFKDSGIYYYIGT